ncbi:predicted protein [Histoplasma mississippiense (nom. inval.)]|uniref:predicted protein n=1 Tax=Ajellomyces capsulatus (strain NAm1 / WU24) TaxID=2059318 RepID=UPI000157CD02|nr:predicted protein [Histoplasma mississippiense (nom. inval.)]EDN09932.1 predicted protein [Histoplasma mississippiense (nom. inval.)]
MNKVNSKIVAKTLTTYNKRGWREAQAVPCFVKSPFVYCGHFIYYTKASHKQMKLGLVFLAAGLLFPTQLRGVTYDSQKKEGKKEEEEDTGRFLISHSRSTSIFEAVSDTKDGGGSFEYVTRENGSEDMVWRVGEWNGATEGQRGAKSLDSRNRDDGRGFCLEKENP